MKKTVRVVSLIVVIALALLALLVLTGCSDTPTAVSYTHLTLPTN